MKRGASAWTRRASLAAWGASVLGTAAVFFGFPELPSRPPAPRPAACDVAYGLAQGGASSTVAYALAAVYSPIAIALPENTPASSLRGPLRNGAPPPVAPPSAAPLYLSAAVPTLRPLTLERPGLAPLAADRLAFGGASAGGVARRANGGGALTVTLRDGLAGKRLDAGTVTLDEWTRAPAPWFLCLSVQVAADGRPQHAFLETATTNAALNGAVLRQLFRCRFEPAGAPCEGRVLLHYPGRAAEAASL